MLCAEPLHAQFEGFEVAGESDLDAFLLLDLVDNLTEVGHIFVGPVSV